MVEIIESFVTPDRYYLKCPYEMTPQYITLHNTENDASAENEIAFMKRRNEYVSFHFAVDDKKAIQAIPLNRNAFHAGDGRYGTGNRASIGIEICYSKSGGERYRKAEENAIQLTAYLLNKFGWGVDRVRKHQDWSGKYCPRRILDEGRWKEVLNRIQAALDELQGKKKAETKPAESKNTAGQSKEYTGNSIVDYLKSIGMDSSFANRKKLAEQYGIKNYTGTAQQNLELLEKMRSAEKKANEKPKEEKKQTKTEPAKSTYTGNSIVDYLNSIGVDSSFANRKKLAEQYGIKNYTGTAEQNLTLLEKLRAAEKSSSGTSSNSKASSGSSTSKSVYTGNSLVDYLKSVNIDSSFANRKKLAEQHGIKNYTGTAEQNTKLLKLLRGF